MASFAHIKSAIYEKEERKQQYQAHIRGLNAFDRHKKFVKDYVDFYGRGERNPNEVLPSKTDQDTLREGYRFIRSEEDDMDTSWEQRLVKRYYDKLFKEYCIADMSQYKKGKKMCYPDTARIRDDTVVRGPKFGVSDTVTHPFEVSGYHRTGNEDIFLYMISLLVANDFLEIGLRWRTEKEVISGKGQFICGNKHCCEKDSLASYEVNFSYIEAGENKQALVKLVACDRCAEKLVYKKRKEKEQLEKKEKEKEEYQKRKRGRSESNSDTEDEQDTSNDRRRKGKKASTSTDDQTIDNNENFDEFLQGMFP